MSILALVIGDFHIPDRSSGIPTQFKELLAPGKVQRVICTGNLCTKETYDFLKTISSEVKLVKGEYDEKLKGLELKEYEVFTIGQFRFGLIHGHQVIPWGDLESLAIWQRKLDVDVLISGNTHEKSLDEYDGKIFLNPGTATGAYSPLSNRKCLPSFLLLDIQGTSIEIYVYSLEDKKDSKEKEVKVRRRVFQKPQ